MTVEYTDRPGSGDDPRLTECPVPGCDVEFGPGCGASRSAHFLNEHGPGDLGDDPRAAEPGGSA